MLRRPTHEVLERFRVGGANLILIWWLFVLSAGMRLFGPLLGPMVRSGLKKDLQKLKALLENRQ